MNLSSKYIGFFSLSILAFILAFSPVDKMTTDPISKSEITRQLYEKTNYIEADQIAHMVIDKDPTVQIIDVRPAQDFTDYNIPGSYSVPIEKLLETESLNIINPDKMVVLASNGNTLSGQAWILLKEAGYKDVYVLHGGMNNWVKIFSSTPLENESAADDEIFVYQFRKAAGAVMMEGNQVSDEESKSVIKPKPVTGKTIKKKKSEGC